jgi:hypothetical protein
LKANSRDSVNGNETDDAPKRERRGEKEDVGAGRECEVSGAWGDVKA